MPELNVVNNSNEPFNTEVKKVFPDMHSALKQREKSSCF